MRAQPGLIGGIEFVPGGKEHEERLPTGAGIGADVVALHFARVGILRHVEFSVSAHLAQRLQGFAQFARGPEKRILGGLLGRAE